MTLLEGAISGKYTVLKLELEQAVGKRLEALGLTEGTQVIILNKKKGGSIIFKVRGTRLAVGKRIADSILVEEEA